MKMSEATEEEKTLITLVVDTACKILIPKRATKVVVSGLEAYRTALEAWRSTIPYIYKAIENDDLVFIEDIRARLSK